MIVAVRNETGFDVFLAIVVSEKSIRFRVFLEEPKVDHPVEKLRPGHGFGMNGCPEGIGARVDVSKAGLTLRVSKRREQVDHIDEFGQLDGLETYLEFTLRLMN